MNRVSLKPLRIQDEIALYTFECENRPYFERYVPSRGDAYYEPEAFRQALEHLLAEQVNGDGYYYLIWHGESIVGRLNVHHVNFETGEIGYRIGGDYVGRGYATAALQQLLTLNLPRFTRLIAKTTTDNKASQHVLMRSGFSREDEIHQIEWEGRFLSFYTYVYEMDR
ncbi:MULTISPECIES: GNAT family N-acetyltransferase [unclassified Exiguobacterium]|uniref:GNAT family N-acetyltransferase n=1 Tax=unclassified Exiguobacterium TaxID=2644629 RepID=UPI001040378D|nr:MULTISPECIES: GNAT family N-acetyltransferase [unclassified Exiguobacterium]TCI36584.1 N-acetyltransferase [Exiguobacterium sp. SH4S7]TCI48636.1 N-acetyltransferase [Exiguobacterium sp. SH5S32]TCI55522.1 N-acetyltransferase [Exiguobacterium sp. SH1S4]TCI63532.1 N-acetyltransferase [Exiguobacterium sp. SH0S2]TCI75319.1 N-acetyltransferase [Exiguobacterium sp. SH1S1]